MSEINDRLAEIRARCGAATPEPWTAFVGPKPPKGVMWQQTVEVQQDGDNRKAVVAWTGFDSSDFQKDVAANARFIAAARSDVPWLLTEVEALRADVQRLEAERDRLREAVYMAAHSRRGAFGSEADVHRKLIAALGEDPTDAD